VTLKQAAQAVSLREVNEKSKRNSWLHWAISKND
jgi:hypothetical protein